MSILKATAGHKFVNEDGTVVTVCRVIHQPVWCVTDRKHEEEKVMNPEAKLLSVLVMGGLKLPPMYGGFRIHDGTPEAVCVNKDYYACVEELAEKSGTELQLVVNMHDTMEMSVKMETFLTAGKVDSSPEFQAKWGKTTGEAMAKLVEAKYPDPREYLGHLTAPTTGGKKR